jgi:hypothetical protein
MVRRLGLLASVLIDRYQPAIVVLVSTQERGVFCGCVLHLGISEGLEIGETKHNTSDQ